MEEFSVVTGADLVDHGWFQVDHDDARYCLAGVRNGEESTVTVVLIPLIAVLVHVAIALDAMLKTEELPTGIRDLNSGLTDVNLDDFSFGHHISRRHLKFWAFFGFESVRMTLVT